MFSVQFFIGNRWVPQGEFHYYRNASWLASETAQYYGQTARVVFLPTGESVVLYRAENAERIDNPTVADLFPVEHN